MKLSPLISEVHEKRSKQIGAETILTALNSHDYSTSLKLFKEEKIIYRGYVGANPYYFVDPSQSERRSKNTTNVYTLLLDNSKRWEKFPKRSKSVICTNDTSISRGYGDTFVLLYPNDAVFGVCPTSDIWVSFSSMTKKFGISYLDYFASLFLKLTVKLYTILTSDGKYQSIYNLNDSITKEQLFEMINAIDSYKKIDVARAILSLQEFFHSSGSEVKSMLEHFKNSMTGENGKSFYEIIDSILDPNENGFSTKNLNTLDLGNISKGVEIWSDSECYMVKIDYAYQALKLAPQPY